MGARGVSSAAFVAGGLLQGVGKGVIDMHVEEARGKRETLLQEMRQKFQSEESALDRTARVDEAEKTRKHSTGLLGNTRKIVGTDDKVWQEQPGGAAVPVTDPQGNQISERSPYAARRGAMLKIGGNSGKIYASDHEGAGDDDEPVVSVSATDALRMKAVQANNDTKLKLGRETNESKERIARSKNDVLREVTDTNARSRIEVALRKGESAETVATILAESRVTSAEKRGATAEEVARIRAEATRDAAMMRADAMRARQYAPDQITKLRAARDQLPDDHPDRDLYAGALRELAKGKGTLTESQVAGLKQRTLKDVQTATDARGKPLYATPEAQDTEVERRLTKVLPAPAPRSPAAKPAAAPAPTAVPDPGVPPAAASPAPAAAVPSQPAPASGTLKGSGTADDPFVATTQADVDTFRATAAPGSIIVINGKRFQK